MDFSERIIRRRSNGDAIGIRCQKATMDYFGWSDAFDTFIKSYKDFYKKDSIGPKEVFGRKLHKGGRRHLICRDRSRQGWTAGRTHCFRITGPWCNRDLRRLAEVAGDKFEWMEGFYGERIYREDWLRDAA